MNKAVCMAWHRYHPHVGEYYRAIWDYWLSFLPLWEKSFDMLYLVDDFFGFTEEDKNKLNQILGEDRWKIIPQEKEGHHWVQFKTAMPHIKERYCLYLDNDVVIYPGFDKTVDTWFKQAEKDKLVTAFDGSGSLLEPMQARFPFLKKMGVASGMKEQCQRMGSYYYILDRDCLQWVDIDLSPKQPYPIGTVLDRISYTTKKGDWSDSYGYFSTYIFDLYGGGIENYHEIPDYRFSLLIMDGKIVEQGTYPTRPEVMPTYYHIRNGNLGCYLLTTKKHDIDAYKKCVEISAPYEALRLLAWFDVYSMYKWSEDIMAIAKDFSVEEDLWKEYMLKFEEYHNV